MWQQVACSHLPSIHSTLNPFAGKNQSHTLTCVQNKPALISWGFFKSVKLQNWYIRTHTQLYWQKLDFFIYTILWSNCQYYDCLGGKSFRGKNTKLGKKEVESPEADSISFRWCVLKCTNEAKHWVRKNEWSLTSTGCCSLISSWWDECPLIH